MNFIKRMHAVLQIRTGFVAVATSALGLAYALGQGYQINLLISFLFITSAFAVNIVTNIANGIAGVKKEDNLKTINDDYVGKNGLVTGKTKLSDAYIALGLFTAYTIFSGMIIVILAKALWFFAIGIVSVFVALIYSIGPKPLTDYPVTEFVSGIFCGFIPTLAMVVFNGGTVTLEVILLSTVSLIIVAMLMLTNNTCDIEKDRGYRVTFAHLLSTKGINYFFLILNALVSLLGFLVISNALGAVAYVVINLILFRLYFFRDLRTRGTSFEGNKGYYIPRYLKYYYQTSGCLCLLLIIF